MSGAMRVGVGGLSLAAGLLALLPVGGCASPALVREGEQLRHARHGYRIAAPPPAWQPIDVDDADLAFRGPRGETMALLSQCGRPQADAAIMARQLVIGLGEWRLRQGGPAAIDGRSGWEQVFDARTPQGIVRVKTVTLVEGRCSFDWLLIVRGDFDAAQPGFDAWRESFRLDATPQAAAPPAGASAPEPAP